MAGQPDRADPGTAGDQSATEIWRYRYHGETVYYRTARCCDIFSDLWDTDGVLLCHPDGGFGGNGDGRCPDFFDARSDGFLIFRDPRSP